MTDMGRALMGTGIGRGDKRAIEAAQQAISSPLLEDVSINGATGILINITGGPDLTLAEINEACSLIAEAADEDANIIFGSVIDAHAGDEVRITVIATGFNSHAHEQPMPTPVARRGARARRADGVADAVRGDAGGAGDHAVPAGGAVAAAVAAHPARRLLRPVGAAAAAPEPVESINTDDFYLQMEQVARRPLTSPSPAPHRQRQRVDARRADRPPGHPAAERRHRAVGPPRERPAAAAAPARRAGRRRVGVRQADLPAPRPLRARVGEPPASAATTQQTEPHVPTTAHGVFVLDGQRSSADGLAGRMRGVRPSDPGRGALLRRLQPVDQPDGGRLPGLRAAAGPP